jgi:hypothetical protein
VPPGLAWAAGTTEVPFELAVSGLNLDNARRSGSNQNQTLSVAEVLAFEPTAACAAPAFEADPWSAQAAR